MGLKDRLQLLLVGGAIAGLVADLVTNASSISGIRLAGNIAVWVGLVMLVYAMYREKQYRDAKPDPEPDPDPENE